ncbi:MAG: hypothetical protein ACRD0P_16585 [Stackebrandtia sp.]
MTRISKHHYAVLIGVLGVVSFLAAQFVGAVSLPLPGEGTGAEIAAAYEGGVTAARFGLLLQAASGFGLLWFATALGAGLAKPYRQLATAGGVAAAVMLTISACTGLLMTQDAALDSPELLPVLQWQSFLTGGAAHVMWLGPMLGGVAIGAAREGLIPKWLKVAGVVIAFAAAGSVLALAVWEASPLIPLGRFGTFAWILVAAPFLLRRETTRPAPTD